MLQLPPEPAQNTATVDFEVCDNVICDDGKGEKHVGMVMCEQSLADLLVSRQSRTILVPVRGESMVGVGILSDDVAVVETGVQAVNGDYVVAEIDDSHTVKEFREARAKKHLVSHSGDDDQAIVPTKNLNIIGVVRGLVRAYRPQGEVTTKLAKGVKR